MHVSKRRSATVFLSGAIAAAIMGGLAASAEDVPAPPSAPAAEVPQSAVPAAPATEGGAAEDGTLELDESPYSVGPSFGGEGPMCPQRRGKALAPSV